MPKLKTTIASEQKKMDRRTRYTVKAIKDAYIELLQQKGRNRIHITDVCKLAEINRCTFYLHFDSLEAVENQIMDELVSKFTAYVNTQKESSQDRLALSTLFNEQILQDESYLTLLRLSQPDYSFMEHERFYCFGCGASGDAIDFTAKYFGISLQSAAEKLCRDYGLSSGNPLRIQSRPNIRNFWEDELLCIQTLSTYRKRLEDWKERYAPHPDSDIWDLRFCEALKALSTVDHLLDCLTIGTLEQRVAMVDSLLVSIIPEMQKRLRKEANAHGRADQSDSEMGGRKENQ